MDNAVTERSPKNRPEFFVPGVYGCQKFLYVFLDTCRAICSLAIHLAQILKCHATARCEEKITTAQELQLSSFFSFLYSKDHCAEIPKNALINPPNYLFTRLHLFR